MSLAPGTRLGSYEIVAPIGAGGMGEVYRAHDANLNRDVALKELAAVYASYLTVSRPLPVAFWYAGCRRRRRA